MTQRRPAGSGLAWARSRWAYVLAGLVSALLFGVIAGQIGGALGLFGTGSAADCTPPDCVSLPTPSTPAGAAEPTDRLRTLLDQTRATAGCAPLTSSAPLANAARDHAADMVARHYVGHAGTAGEGPQGRAVQYGYTGSTTELIVTGIADPAQAAKALFGPLTTAEVQQRARACSWLSAGVAFDNRAVRPDQAPGVWVIVLGDR